MKTCENGIYAVMDELFERRRYGGLYKLKKVVLYFQREFTLEQIRLDGNGIRCETKEHELGIQVTKLPVEREDYGYFQTED